MIKWLWNVTCNDFEGNGVGQVFIPSFCRVDLGDFLILAWRI